MIESKHRISPARLRLYRAVLEGISLEKAWNSYMALDEPFSVHAAQRVLDHTRSGLVSWALSTGQPALAALLRRQPQRIWDSPVPTLAEFSASLAQPDDWSEAELLALWQEAYGKPSAAAQRRDRLVKRLRAALEQLTPSTSLKPMPDDAISRWLPARQAQLLARQGVQSLRQLAQALATTRRKGPLHPLIGDDWAGRLRAWLADEQLLPGPDSLTMGVRPSHCRPLEQMLADPPVLVTAATPLVVPKHLAGVGTKGGTSQPPVADPKPDLAAVQAWLSGHSDKPHTLRTYRRTAERLLMWCHHERGIGLDGFNGEEADRYLRWLADLGRLDESTWQTSGWRLPASAWLAAGPFKASRESADWRPLSGPLSSRSLAHELAVLKAMTNHLARTGYLLRRPFDDLLTATTAPPVEETSITDPSTAAAQAPLAPGLAQDDGQPRGAARAAGSRDESTRATLADRHWHWLLQGGLASSADVQARLWAVLWLARACGLRASDLLGLRLGDLAPLRGHTHGTRLQADGSADAAATLSATFSASASASASGQDATDASTPWQLSVATGSTLQRWLLLPKRASRALLDYLKTVGVAPADLAAIAASPDHPAATQPLLRAQRGRRSSARPAPSMPLRYSTLQASLQQHLRARAQALRAVDPAAADALQQASLGWLRSCFAQQAIRSGAPLSDVQTVLGHRSPASTWRHARRPDDHHAASPSLTLLTTLAAGAP